MEGRDPKSVSPEQAGAIAETLEGLFGTPDAPRSPEAAALDPALLATAAGPVGGDAEGSHRGLYRRHCATCHGITGDGAGPTASILDPYPRDYRNGVFKYTSTMPGHKPLKTDLHRTLIRGILDTAMPSFAQLPEGEIDALVEYVKYLSIRGQTEQYLFEMVVDDDAKLPIDADQVIEEGVLPIARSSAAPRSIRAWWSPRRPGLRSMSREHWPHPLPRDENSTSARGPSVPGAMESTATGRGRRPNCTTTGTNERRERLLSRPRSSPYGSNCRSNNSGLVISALASFTVDRGPMTFTGEFTSASRARRCRPRVRAPGDGQPCGGGDLACGPLCAVAESKVGDGDTPFLRQR